jgi:hypothetical protein
MKSLRRHWLLVFAIALVIVSAIVGFAHHLIFHDPHTYFFYLVMDLSFLPLEALIVGLVIERFIAVREKQEMAHKLNMVIGAFFSELGTPLIRELLPCMTELPEIKEHMRPKASWNKEEFLRASQFARNLSCGVELSRIDLLALKNHLVDSRPFILRLLENPNLLEHDRFTDLLWAVLHLEEELEARESLTELRPADEAHLEVDVRRAVNHLLAEWTEYANHLKQDYPYLFSLVVRLHPFQEAASAEVTE